MTSGTQAVGSAVAGRCHVNSDVISSSSGVAHAKSFSVLQDTSGRWQPAPAYDLSSSQPYGDTTMALSVDGRRDGNVPGDRFVALGEKLGVRPRPARAVVERVVASADAWLDGLAELPFDERSTDKLARPHPAEDASAGLTPLEHRSGPIDQGATRPVW